MHACSDIEEKVPMEVAAYRRDRNKGAAQAGSAAARYEDDDDALRPGDRVLVEGFGDNYSDATVVSVQGEARTDRFIVISLHGFLQGPGSRACQLPGSGLSHSGACMHAGKEVRVKIDFNSILGGKNKSVKVPRYKVSPRRRSLAYVPAGWLRPSVAATLSPKHPSSSS